MNEGKYQDMVIEHDKHIDSLAQSVGTLSESVKSTNGKLDTVIDAITKQNVLTEKFANLDRSLTESFHRYNDRIEALEDSTKEQMSPTTLRWFLGILVAYGVTFGGYITAEVHRLDNLATEKIHMQRGINKAQKATNIRVVKEITMLNKFQASMHIPITEVRSSGKY